MIEINTGKAHESSNAVVASPGNETTGSLSDGLVRIGQRPARVPLSHAQQRIWFIDQVTEHRMGFQIVDALRLRGPLDEKALRNTIDAIVKRHEILRTQFAGMGDETEQIVAANLQLALPLEDLSELDSTSQEERVRAARGKEWEDKFDLTRGPLLRLKLLKLGEQEHILVRTFHYIIFDGKSLDIFNHEFGKFYGAFCEDRQNIFKPLPLQYADFVLWQRQRLAEDTLSHDLAFWTEQMRGAPEVLDLPKDRQRPFRHNFSAGGCSTRAPFESLMLLKSRTGNESTNTYIILLTTLAILLAKYTGQEDVIIGSPFETRDKSGLDLLIGFFVNLLPIRIRANPLATFQELLAMVTGTVREAVVHQNLPFERLVAELSPQRSLNVAPVFQVEFELHNVCERGPVMKGLDVEALPQEKQQVGFDLEVNAFLGNDHLEIQWVYSRELFDPWRIDQMARHFLNLLKAAGAEPNIPVYRLKLLSADEQDYLWANSVGSRHSQPREFTHEMFEKRVQAMPYISAVIEGELSIAYSDLNEQANRLAHYLIFLGIKPEDVIGVCMKRSITLVKALLAVFKAGGVYLPLEADHRALHVDRVIGEAAPRAVICCDATAPILPASIRIVNLDSLEIESALVNAPSHNPSNDERMLPLRPAHPAYVIYTSGSTGTPKGVVVSHQALANKVSTLNDFLGISVNTRYAASTSLSFDPLLEQILCPLCAGATCVCIPPKVQENVDLFIDAVQRYNISVIDSTPGLVEVLMPATRLAGHLDCLLIGGDVLSVETAHRVYAANVAKRILNFYGPTEACIDATAHEIAWDTTADIVPIGKPLPNYSVYVLDQQLEMVPIGICGELYISGVGVARGYLKQPIWTAERFVADPFAAKPGGRMYRTGDLGCWRKEGTLQFLGRADEQLKIRGCRVEPGEVEKHLKSHSLVDKALVVAAGQGNHRRLIAYVSVKKDATTSTPGETLFAPEESYETHVQFEATLLQFLRDALPSYMVPSSVTVLLHWPLTSNGKVDRQALPEPKIQSKHGYRAPRTKNEEILCAIFSEVLSLDRVGIHDNFFDLGGHSLLAMRLAGRIQAVLTVEVALSTIFLAPTVADLTSHLVPSREHGIPLVPKSRPRQLPLSYPQQRLWFLDQMDEASTEYNWPDAWRFRGNLNVEILIQCIATIVYRHEILRTRFDVLDGEPQQFIVPPSSIHFPVEDLSRLEIEEQQEYIAKALSQEWANPFDLVRGPLFRMKLLRLGAEDHILLWTFHHIVWDGWSQDIFSRELTVLYEAFCAGQPDPLAPLLIQYSDFALWQRVCLDDKKLDGELVYWKEQLMDLPEELGLPRDHIRQSTPTFTADICRMVLPVQQTTRLKELSRVNQATPYMTFLAVFAMLLERYSGQEDIVIGSPIANRQEEQVQHLIGFFVNSLVIRVHVRPETTFHAFLQQVRRTALNAYLHQDLPFERLVEELAPERHLNKTPIFQVAFANLETSAGIPKLKGLEVERIRTDTCCVRFDLEIHALQNADSIEFEWIYNRSLFDKWRIEQMTRHYEHLLANALENENAPLLRIPLLTAAECHEVLKELNATQRTLPSITLPELFEAQSGRVGDALALVLENKSISYRQLNERANRLAHILIRYGVGPEKIVGIYIKRSFEMIVALLGILKTGAAYLPLDPGYPEARLATILKDASPIFVLTCGQGQSSISQNAQVLDLQTPEMRQALDQASVHNPTDAERICRLLPEHPAYMIYTSGSTGKPKGVIITHTGISSLAGVQIEHLGLTPRSRILQFASLCFDASLWEIMMAFATGAALILVPSQLLGGRELHDVFVQQRITHVLLPPVVLPTLENANDLCLETLVVGGEACRGNLVPRWSKGRRMINAYGPTEVTVCSTMSSSLSNSEAPIGLPIWNTTVYVLDRSLNPVPFGVAGELYIAGPGLARGYFNQPRQTAHRFVANPYGPPGARMYRTGDLVRWRPDRSLEFIGRSDRQIKIRGFRLEPSEIEDVLKSHEHITDAIVAVREHGEQQQLVAYVITSLGDVEEARSSYIRRWQELYESTYQDGSTASADFNVVGWNSSYTGDPIPAEEMRIWTEETVKQLRSLRPAEVLEIGCGTGLLLTRLAPACKQYIGIDFSRECLTHLRRHLDREQNSDHILLRHGLAHELFFAETDAFDLTIINSVVQYFPDVQYLLGVLSEAVRVTKRGGHVFIGDVRSLPLLEAYYASVELYKSSSGSSIDELRSRIRQAQYNETELVLDPALFLELGRRWEKVALTKISPKAGAYDNELSRFRYDVTLQLGSKQRLASSYRALPWDKTGSWRTDVQEALGKQPDLTIALRNIPDKRVAGFLEAVRHLKDESEELSTVGEIKDACAGAVGEDLNSLMQLAENLGTELHWRFSHDGFYEAIFNPGWEQQDAWQREDVDFDLCEYATIPMQRQRATVLAGKLREHLLRQLPDYMVPAAFVALQSWPMTPNGKLNHSALPLPGFLASTRQRPKNHNEELLCTVVANVLGISEVGVDDNFFSLGGDSIVALQLVSHARRSGLLLTPRDIFQFQTVAGLAKIAQPTHGEALHARDTESGALVLTPIMHWIMELGGSLRCFSQSLLLQVPAGLQEQHLVAALQAVLDHHDILRFRVVQQSENGAWSLEILSPGSVSADSCIQRVNIIGLDDEERAKIIAREAEQTALRLLPESGKNVQIAWLDAGPNSPGRLLLTIHHFAVDGVSWRILSADLRVAYQALSAGKCVELEPCRTSFRRWSALLHSEARHPARIKERDHWESALRPPPPSILKERLDPKRDVMGVSGRFTDTLAQDISWSLLNKAPAVLHARTQEILIAAIVLAVARWHRSGHSSTAVLLDIEGHGREPIFDVDVSRTVGWFTSLFPVRFDIGQVVSGSILVDDKTLGQALQLIKDQLRSIADNGIGYGLLRYLNPETATTLAARPRPEICFNYLGRFSALGSADWTIAEDLPGVDDPEMSMGHGLILDVVALERDAGPELVATWSWAPSLVTEIEVRQLSQDWFYLLGLLAAYATRPEAKGLSPSDVPLVSLTQNEIDDLQERIRMRFVNKANDNGVFCDEIG